MRVTSLKLANLRAIKVAEFRFRPGINLLVGVNGVGKSTVLSALAAPLSAVVKQANGLRTRVRGFKADDIRVGTDVLDVECATEIEGIEYRYMIHRPREAGTRWAGGMDMPHKARFWGRRPVMTTDDESTGRPLAVWFDTRRAVPSERKPSKTAAAGGVKAAFGDALASRELRLGELAAWMGVQEALRSEHRLASRALDVFKDVVRRFLPGYGNLRVDGGGRRLMIDRGGDTVVVRHMSDGERGVLALVLDLTRRLFQANPEMRNPVTDAEAVVLIDEIDLHLHPAWQRRIVERLTSTFPRCQFIATTHSPQVIGEVEHDRIHIMTDEGVYSPTHSFGVDSSRVLEEIMEVVPRTERVQTILSQASRAIARERYDEARVMLANLVNILGENDAETIRMRTLIRFLEGSG